MSQIIKIEEVNRSKFDSIVKFNTRMTAKSGNIILAEIRIKGEVAYFYVIEKCAHERAVKLVRAYIRRLNSDSKHMSDEGSLPLAA